MKKNNKQQNEIVVNSRSAFINILVPLIIDENIKLNAIIQLMGTKQHHDWDIMDYTNIYYLGNNIEDINAIVEFYKTMNLNFNEIINNKLNQILTPKVIKSYLPNW